MNTILLIIEFILIVFGVWIVFWASRKYRAGALSKIAVWQYISFGFIMLTYFTSCGSFLSRDCDGFEFAFHAWILIALIPIFVCASLVRLMAHFGKNRTFTAVTVVVMEWYDWLLLFLSFFYVFFSLDNLRMFVILMNNVTSSLYLGGPRAQWFINPVLFLIALTIFIIELRKVYWYYSRRDTHT